MSLWTVEEYRNYVVMEAISVKNWLKQNKILEKNQIFVKKKTSDRQSVRKWETKLSSKRTFKWKRLNKKEYGNLYTCKMVGSSIVLWLTCPFS